MPGNHQNEKIAHLEPGTILSDRYFIIEVLGIGGMGTVYKARDMHFSTVERFVAVKEIINQVTDPAIRQTCAQNLERETGLLATLDHPSIPIIFDNFSNDERSFVVMEYIDGTNLETTITQETGFIDEELVLKWAIDLCDVLDYLHGHKPDPIIFRDIKPSNIMLNNQGKMKLIGFGLAKAFQSPVKGAMIGTEGYAAPEQYQGIATPLVDIYALGATLHHIITRRDPCNEPPFSFTERQVDRIHPSISPEFGNIVMKALQNNPGDRFQSASLMKDALLEIRKLTRSNNSRVNKLIPSSKGKQPLWIYTCEDEIRSSVLLHDDSIFFGSYDKNLYSLQASDGSLNWKYKTEAGIMSAPALYENDVYIGSGDQRLHVVNKRTGKINWSYYTGGQICTSPRIAEGHVFLGSDDSHLHAINLLSGRSVWRFEAASPIRSTPCITNEMIYFGSESGIFYALDFHGDIIWTYATKMGISSSPTICDGIVYFASRDSYIYALDARGGWIKWRFHMAKGSNSSPCIYDGILYIGSADGNIYALDSRTGKEIWRFLTEHQVSSSPAIDGGFLYCGSADGYLYCLNAHTGTMQWKFLTQAAITGIPIILNGVIVIGSLDHSIYALSV